VTAARVEAKLQMEGAAMIELWPMNDDAEAVDEAMAVRSRWKMWMTKRIGSQFGQGWQTIDLFHGEATPVACGTIYLFYSHFASTFQREDPLSNFRT
jgi:hypothetical protein